MVTPRRHRLTLQMQMPRTRYVPIERIAVGGMAEVWRGIATTHDGRTYPVAIKRVRPDLEHKQVYQSMFEDEARLSMMLRHPNIVRVYEARKVNSIYVMIMELVDGISLQQLMTSAHARGAMMPVGIAVHVARQVAIALDYAHRIRGPRWSHLAVVHRDVSPHNVLLAVNGTAKLLDFGLSEARIHRTRTSSDVTAGKLAYLAPELIDGHRSTTRVDIFGLGVILWELLAGKRLFHAQSDEETAQRIYQCAFKPARDTNPDVPFALDELLRAMLAKNPIERPASTHAVADQLRQIALRYDLRAETDDVALIAHLHKSANQTMLKAANSDSVRRMAKEMELFSVISGMSSPELYSVA